MSSSNQYYLVCGTMQELHLIARERNIDPRSIRLVRRTSDIHGYRGGKIIFGHTGIFDHSVKLSDILAYARMHDIETP